MKLFITLVYLISFNLKAGSMQEYFPEITNRVDRKIIELGMEKLRRPYEWMYSTSRSIEPSGAIGFHIGHQSRWVYHFGKSNGADNSFGYGLMYTYELYCKLRNLKKNCLSNNLLTYFRAKGKTRGNHRFWFKMYKLKNGRRNTAHSRSHSSYKGIMYHYFKYLNRTFGKVPTSKYTSTITALLKRYVQVNMYVIQDTQGIQNTHWSKKQSSNTNDMLSRANKLLAGDIGFSLARVSKIKSSELYDKKSMTADLKYMRAKKLKGTRRVTFCASNQNQVKNSGFYPWGLSFINNSIDPYFCMRRGTANKLGSEKERDHTAKIFLHELGHGMMGLRHEGTMNTDNYYRLSNPSINLTNRHINRFLRLYPY